MKYLFIDTETTGLSQEDSFSIDAINSWPWLVSVEDHGVIDCLGKSMTLRSPRLSIFAC